MSASQSPNDPGLFVLVSLASGPRHGHAILLDVEQYAGVRMGPGTLYGAISRLESEGLIEPLAAEGRRRPYRISDGGRSVLAGRLRGLEQTVRTGLSRVAVEP
jgi:DNA-binding PadR family transcriptional regulator